MGTEVVRTGTPVLASYWRGLVEKELPALSALALLFVAVVLYLNYGSWILLFSVLIPLAGGVSLMLILMRSCGMEVNIFNMAVLPMVIGIGIDDGIYFTDRWLESRDVVRVLSGTGSSVLLTSLTTAAGFASFMWADFGGLKYVGAAGVAGLMCCWAATVVFLPVFLILLKDRLKC